MIEALVGAGSSKSILLLIGSIIILNMVTNFIFALDCKRASSSSYNSPSNNLLLAFE